MVRFALEPLPHLEAIEYFRSKGHADELVRFHHLDHWREEHARNWVVAKAMRDDVSQTIRTEVGRMLVEGRTIRQASADLAPRLKEMGWWGKALMEDPVAGTGEMEEVQLGSMSRLRTIFHANMNTAHAAGHWAAIQRTKKAFPYLHYIQLDRPSKRPAHARFHDRIWHVDDPIWLRIYPPNGYWCACRVLQRTEGWMRRNSRTVDESLDLDEIEWEHPRSGETHMVPRGITPGFDVNPGAVWLDMRRGWEAVTPDLAPEERASQRGLVEGLRLRRLGEARERLVVTDAGSRPHAMLTASADRPDVVMVSTDDVPAGGHILHSHISETTLSIEDIDLLYSHNAASITAIAPGGSIWRARRGTETPRLADAAFIQRALLKHRAELAALDPGEARAIWQHARMLWLEKNGVITYSYSVSARNRQLFARHEDLIRSLSDDRHLSDA